MAIQDVARIALFSPDDCRRAKNQGWRPLIITIWPAFTFANATHIATVEVDIETGKVKILRYVVV